MLALVNTVGGPITSVLDAASNRTGWSRPDTEFSGAKLLASRICFIAHTVSWPSFGTSHSTVEAITPESTNWAAVLGEPNPVTATCPVLPAFRTACATPGTAVDGTATIPFSPG